MSDKLAFQADVSKMLDIVVNSLYSEKQIFLRELISNASDACDKLKYLALTNPDIAKASGQFKIKIVPNSKENKLTVSDNGIGMNKEDLINHLGTIAKSGTADFVRNVKMKRACMMLSSHSVTISEVAYAVGFNNPKYFTKCFKEEFGVTPTEYQQMQPS